MKAIEIKGAANRSGDEHSLALELKDIIKDFLKPIPDHDEVPVVVTLIVKRDG